MDEAERQAIRDGIRMSLKTIDVQDDEEIVEMHKEWILLKFNELWKENELVRESDKENERLNGEIQQLRQERDELKRENTVTRSQKDEFYAEMKRQQAINVDIEKECDEWKEKAERYEEALREEMRFFEYVGEPIEVYNIAKQALGESE